MNKNFKPKHWVYIATLLLLLLSLFFYWFFEPKPFLGFLCFFTALIGIHLILKDWRIKNDSKILKMIHTLFYLAASLGLGLGLFLWILILSPQNSCKELDAEKIEEMEIMIILGAGLKKGELPPHLMDRLDLALEAINASKLEEITIVVTGGVGQNETLSEAQVMGAYLVEKGVPEEWIIYENRATSTVENFKFSQTKLQNRPNNDQNILMITSDFHIYRSTLIAKHFGFEPTPLCSQIPLHLKMGATLREIAALAKDGLRMHFL